MDLGLGIVVGIAAVTVLTALLAQSRSKKMTPIPNEEPFQDWDTARFLQFMTQAGLAVEIPRNTASRTILKTMPKR